MSPTNHAPPFPALTTAQRWHLEVNGYVVVENVLGPDDGGTCVIAGCHKATCAEESIIQAAREDPSLIHQVVAPAGSTPDLLRDPAARQRRYPQRQGAHHHHQRLQPLEPAHRHGPRVQRGF